MKFIFKFCGKKSLFVLILASFVIVVLDLIGIALIFPFLNLFVSPENMMQNKFMNRIYETLDLNSVDEFVYIIGLILIASYIFKFVLKTTSLSISYRIYADLTYRLSTYLFNGLLKAKYALFTEHGASEMITIVNAQTVHAVICLESIVKVLNEIVFLLLVIIILSLVNFEITLWVVTLFFIFGISLYFGLIKKIGAYGRIHTNLNVLVYKYGYAMASSIKDIKIMSLENNYIKKFSGIWKEYSYNDSRSKVVKGIPADLSETMIFVGVIFVCIYLLATNQVVKDVIPLLGVLAVSAIRLLPSFNRITANINQFKFYKASLKLIVDLNEKLKKHEQSIRHLYLPFKENLEVKSLSFQYGDKIILDSVSLKLNKGESCAFVGVSGSGKSTLLDVLVGLREPKSGSFYLDGISFDPFNTDALRNYVGYVPQNVSLIDETISFNIAFEESYNVEKMNRVLSIAHLDKFVSELELGLDTILGENGVRVSGGQKQRIGIARALYREPEILVLDEATSALDTKTERKLMSEINQLSKDKTLIIVAHRLSTVENCNTINLLDNGKIIARGNHLELLEKSPEYRTFYYQQEQEEK